MVLTKKCCYYKFHACDMKWLKCDRHTSAGPRHAIPAAAATASAAAAPRRWVIHRLCSAMWTHRDNGTFLNTRSYHLCSPSSATEVLN